MEIIIDKYKLIELGYLKQVAHPNGELFLYNYTNKAQFDKAWQEYPQLLECRGLILDKDNNYIARPFAKFFNIEEHQELPEFNYFEITDKLDGSLIIVSWYKGEMIVSTRGSFDSEQAIQAKEMLKDSLGLLNKEGYTFLFELVGKKNQIVVNYEEDYKLVLLAIIENKTNQEFSRITLDIASAVYDFDVVKQFDGIKDFRECREILKRDNAEGFVVRFDNGLRVKLKYADYVRLHKLMTGISERDILDILKAKQDITTLLDRVPDEYYKWVHEVKERIETCYTLIEGAAFAFLCEAKKLPTRKEQAEYILSKAPGYSAVIFKMLDSKEYSSLIYKLINVDGQRKFKCEN
jgi:RNA ligase